MFSVPRTVVVFALFLGMVYPLNTAAHDLRSGDRVRLRTADGGGRQLIGTVVSIDDSSLVLRSDPPNQTTAIPLTSVTRLDRSAGTKGHAMAGALIGAAAGLVVGIATRESSQTEGTQFGGASDASGLATVLLVMAGGGVGALIGNSIRTDQWDRVDNVSIDVAPAGAPGRAVAVSLHFDF